MTFLLTFFALPSQANVLAWEPLVANEPRRIYDDEFAPQYFHVRSARSVLGVSGPDLGAAVPATTTTSAPPVTTAAASTSTTPAPTASSPSETSAPTTVEPPSCCQAKCQFFRPKDQLWIDGCTCCSTTECPGWCSSMDVSEQGAYLAGPNDCDRCPGAVLRNGQCDIHHCVKVSPQQMAYDDKCKGCPNAGAQKTGPGCAAWCTWSTPEIWGHDRNCQNCVAVYGAPYTEYTYSSVLAVFGTLMLVLGAFCLTSSTIYWCLWRKQAIEQAQLKAVVGEAEVFVVPASALAQPEGVLAPAASPAAANGGGYPSLYDESV